MLVEDGEAPPNVVQGACGVPGVGPLGDGPEGLLRARSADQDRQVRLDRARLAEGVAERVEAAGVVEPLAVEEAAQEHDRLVEPIEPLAEPGAPGLVEPERVMLALEPGAADPEHGSSGADVVEGRCQLGGEPGVAERVGSDHQAEPNARRQGAQGGESGPALEDRLLPRPEDREQVVPRPDRVPAGAFGSQRSVTEVGPRGVLGPELGAKSHRHERHDRA